MSEAAHKVTLIRHGRPGLYTVMVDDVELKVTAFDFSVRVNDYDKVTLTFDAEVVVLDKATVVTEEAIKQSYWVGIPSPCAQAGA